MTPRKVFIVAGEASGDRYAGQVVRALLNRQPELEVRGWGGEEMEAAGAMVTQHYRDLAFMGFWEVLRNLKTIRRNLKRCWKEIESFAPDVLLGVDFPGFNLRIARKARQRGLVVHHYISPSIWAWRRGRIRTIQRDINRMYVTLPFEAALYEAAGMDVQFVGHPLLDVRADFLADPAWKELLGLDESKSLVALLPGSRTQELVHLLPVLIEAASLLPPEFQPVVAGAPGQPPSAYSQCPFPVVFGHTQELLAHAEFAWVTSGTATLEAALFNTPQVIVYKTSGLTYRIAKSLAQVEHIGLPNLIAKRSIVPELIQDACTAEALIERSHGLIGNGAERAQQLRDYEELQVVLGSTGAAERVAEGVLAP